LKIIKNKNVQLFTAIVIFSFTGVMAKLAAMSGIGVYFFMFLGLQILLLVGYAIIWQQILKKFALITVTAAKGMMIVLNLIWAVLIFNEIINLFNIIGTAIIITGVYIVATDEVADG